MILFKFLNPANYFKKLRGLLSSSFSVATFLLFLLVHLFSKVLLRISKFPLLPGFVKFFIQKVVKLMKGFLNFMSGYKEDTINRVSLIDLAIRNMLFKKNRAFITIGGMALGIGSIVFLVSLGYGINKLVVDKVARLEEMQQADVNTLPGNDGKITDKSIAQFLEFEHVNLALPQIAVVAKVNYQNSSSDMAVYGVTAEYLNQSAVQPSYGKIFTSNDVSELMPKTGEVAGLTTQELEELESESHLSDIVPLSLDHIAKVNYQIDQGKWVRVRSEASLSGEIIGYTKQYSDDQQAEMVWGSPYQGSDSGSVVREETETIQGKWIFAKVPIWQEQCVDKTQEPCAEFEYTAEMDESGEQKQIQGYFALVNASTEETEDFEPQVLGISTDTDTSVVQYPSSLIAQADLTETNTTATDQENTLSITDSDTQATTTNSTLPSGDIDIATLTSLIDASDEAGLAQIASEAAGVKAQQVKSVPLDPSASKQAVVNTAMLSVLGVQPQEAVGKTFESSFIVVGSLLDSDEKVESIPAQYTIIGVIQDDSSPFFYVPFMDLRKLGITNYSQAKIVVDDQVNLADARTKIESIGFATSSTADTVEQIDRLFATLRSVLALLGMVALAVASLGMFNTLTVSLLERTREVGLMKAMGMKSKEVRELFLTESMIMGFMGGISGILMGFLAGKMLSVLISSLAIAKGQGFLDVSYIPTGFVIVVFALSMIVGIVTGIYPARRATSISALNALRYE